jgi:hypothetical protein
MIEKQEGVVLIAFMWRNGPPQKHARALHDKLWFDDI